MNSKQQLILIRYLFYLVAVLLLIYPQQGECNIRPKRAITTTQTTTDGFLDRKVGVLRVWQIMAMSLGGLIILVIVISCFVRCRIPESQATRLKRLQEKRHLRPGLRDERDHPATRSPPQYLPRPNYPQPPYHDPRQVEVQLRQYPSHQSPPHLQYPQSRMSQYEQQQMEQMEFRPHSPRHSIEPNRYESIEAKSQYRPLPKANRDKRL
ncbi:hypothetical protein TrispH2_007118 [Trichoplax sp. H2]|nr:hypothetical protein TrispH2_007118 [Trichoplax sp. H2]|eukprot:RDD40175.1 hypothetical protein TrispH2_007118 [Trichoplax sp. H2]